MNQFFSDPASQRHSWNHTSFLLPQDFDLAAIGDDNSFLLSLEQGRVVGLVQSGNKIHALHGGDLTPGARAGTDWFHVAMTYEPGTWRLYLDGDLAAERINLNGTINPSANPLTWGHISSSSSVRLPGGVGDVRIYDSGLAAAQVVDLMRIGEGLSPLDPANNDIAGAVGIWPTDEGNGTTVGDETQNADGTVQGNAIWTTQGTGGGLLFDGVDDGVEVAGYSFPASSDGLTVAGWFKLDPNASSSDPLPLVGQWETQAQLRFIDVGVRPTGVTGKMTHHLTDDVDDQWDSLVLCRLYLTPTNPVPCFDDVAPYAFNAGHNLDWLDRANAPLFSTWRVATPALDVPAVEPGRTHGADASILRLTQSLRTGNAGADPTGNMDYDCAYVAFHPYEATLTEGDPTPSGEPQSCPSSTLVSSPEKESTIPESSSTGDLLWCDDIIEQHSPFMHDIEAVEQLLWPASSTCGPIENEPMPVAWDDLLKHDRAAFATAITDLVQASNETTETEARGAVDQVLRKAIGDRLAIWWDSLGMPMNVTIDGTDPLNILDASDFHVVDIPPNHIEIGTPLVQDRDQWVEMTDPHRLAFTRALLPVNATFTPPQGPVTIRELTLLLEDVRPELTTTGPVVQLGNDIAGGVKAKDLDNTNHTLGFDLNTVTPFSLPLVNVSKDGSLIGEGLFEVGYKLPADTMSVEACARQLWTADPTGIDTNLITGALGIENIDLATCDVLNIAERIRLHLFETITITLEVREGNKTVAWPIVVGSAGRQLIENGTLDEPLSLERALDATYPIGPEEPMNTGTIRIVLVANVSTPEQKADLAAFLLMRLAGLIDTFAFEMYDIPLPPHLKGAVERSVRQHQATILVPTGSLDPTALDLNGLPVLPVQDRLMSITGLSAHPDVLSIGGGSLAAGADPLNRLGPTAIYAPKPDFLAPSPAGTTIGAVLNTLPYVEAMQLRGLHHLQLVKAVLAGLSVPVTSIDQSGDRLPATFYEQGYGALDLGAFLNLNATVDQVLNEVANRTEASYEMVLANTTAALAVNEQQLQNASANEILGAAATPEALLRSALSNVLVRLTLDSPAIPTTLFVDHGVVNHEKAGNAHVVPFDLDAVLASTVNATRTILKEAGWTGTQLDDMIENLTDRIRISLTEGQDVKVNVTHYYLFDALKDDLLYTLYDSVLNRSVEENGQFFLDTVENFTTDPAEQARNILDEWLLKPYHLTEEWNGRVETDIRTTETCIIIPIVSTLVFGDKIIKILNREATSLEGTTHEAAALSIEGRIPADSQSVLSRSGQRLVQGQLTQVACGHDVIFFLELLRDIAQELHQLKGFPYGHWSGFEQDFGAWGDDTPLGEAINETLVILGIDPEDFRQDAPAAVLNLTIDAIDRALFLVEQKVSLLGLPKTEVVDYTRADVRTKPNATQVAPLGPYVGLALVTSRDVTLYNPFTNESILTRDISIPLPAFLWNNPSLEVKPTFRDGTPLRNMTATLMKQKVDVFDNVTVNALFDANGTLVPLYANLTKSLEKERGIIEALLANITLAQADLESAIENITGEVPTPYHALADAFADAEALLLKRLQDIDDDLAEGVVPDEVFESILERLIATLYSRMRYQSGHVDQNGTVSMPSLFPGRYDLFAPYPYHKVANHTVDHPYANAGTGAYGGTLLDEDWLTHEFVANTLVGLPGQEPANAPEPGSPPPGVVLANASSVSMWPIHEVDGARYGPFHQFSLDVTGPDLLGLTCLVLQRVAEATETPIGFPGCGQPLIPTEFVLDLMDKVQLAECVAGTFEAPDNEGWQYCSEIQLERAELNEACWNGDNVSCVALNRTLPVGTATLGLAVGLQSLLPADQTLVPWPHSIVRMVKQDREDFGYEQGNLENRTHEYYATVLNQTVPASDVTAAVGAALAALDDLLDNALDVTEPPRASGLDTVEPLGLLHHVTDKVSGLDWWHTDILGVNLTAEDITETDIEAELDRLVAMVDDAGDKGDLLTLVNVLKADPALVDRWSAGYDWTVENRSAIMFDGNNMTWAPNGLVTSGLTPAENSTREFLLDEVDLCTDAVDWNALSPVYLDCDDPLPLDVNEACSVGDMRVDRVTMINELLTAYRASGTTDALDAIEQAVGMASAGHGWEWTRTKDAIRAAAHTDALGCQLAPVTPLPAILHYTTPIPSQERMTVRMHGEFVTKDTMAIVITTPDGKVPKAVVGVMEDIDETFTGEPRLPLDLIQAVLENLTRVAGKSDLRAEILGFPVRAEVQAIQPAKKADQTHGTSGLLAVRSHEHHILNRVYDFRTKNADVEAISGEPLLHTMVLFLPNIGGTGTLERPLGVGQKFMVRDLTIQMDTFAGIRGDSIQGDNVSLDLPIRYRANVEDWNMMWTSPDQALATASEPEGLTLAITNSGGSVSIPQDEWQWTRGFDFDDLKSKGWVLHDAFDYTLSGWCPNEQVPGMDPNHGGMGLFHQGGPDPVEGGEYWMTWPRDDDLCKRTLRAGLAPGFEIIGSREPANITPYLEFDENNKELVNVIPYHLNFGVGGFGETFSLWSPALDTSPYCTLCDPLSLLTSMPPSEAAKLVLAIMEHNGLGTGAVESRFESGKVMNALDQAFEDARDITTEGSDATTDYARDVRRALLPFLALDLPLLDASFDVRAQHGRENIPVAADRVHNVAALNKSQAMSLMSDPWDPYQSVTITERSIPALANQSTLVALDAPIVDVQVIRQDSEKNAYAAVTAWRSGTTYDTGRETDIKDRNEAGLPEPSGATVGLIQRTEFLLGNGQTGNGWVVEVEASGMAQVVDTNGVFATQGLRFAGKVTYATTIYMLGGNLTTNSHCGNIDIYNYVSKFFNCNGYSQALAFSGEINPGAEPTRCMLPTAEFARQISKEGLDTGTSFQSWKYTNAFQDMLINDLLKEGALPAAFESDLKGDLNSTEAFSTAAAGDGAAVIACIAFSLLPGLPLPLISSDLADHIILALTGLTARVALPEHNLQASLGDLAAYPDLWHNGPPANPGTFLTPVGADLQIPGPFGWFGAPVLPGILVASYIDPQNFTRADVSVAIYDANGTLVATNDSVFSTNDTGVHSFNFDVDHDHRYVFTALGTDIFGNEGRSTAQVRIDHLLPEFVGLPGQPAWVDLDPTLAWMARDMTSGLHNVTVEVDNGAGWEVHAVLNGTDPGISVGYEHLLDLTGVTGAVNDVRITLLDKALHAHNHTTTIREDHENPLFTNDLSFAPFLNADVGDPWSVRDLHSGLASVVFEQTGGGDPRVVAYGGAGGGVPVTNTTILDIGATDGATIGWSIEATDEVGRTTTLANTSVVDISLPWIHTVPTLPVFLNAADLAADPQLSWISRDNVSGLQVATLVETGVGTVADFPAVAANISSPVRSHPLGLPSVNGATKTLTFTETDLAGNLATWSETYTADLEPPRITITTDVPLANGLFDRDVNVTIDVSDLLSGVESTTIKLNGTTVSGTTFQLSGHGIHTLEVVTEDKVGNTNTSVFRIGIDLEDPLVGHNVPLKLDGTLDDGLLSGHATALDAISGITGLTYTLVNVTGTDPVNLSSGSVDGFSEDFEAGKAPNGWTGPGTIVDDGPLGHGKSLKVSVVRTVQGFQSATAIVDPGNLSRDEPLWVSMDWKWSNEGTVTSASPFFQLFYGFPGTSNFKVLRYHLRGTGSSGCEPAICNYAVGADAPQEHVWGRFERNITADIIEANLPATYPLAQIQLISRGTSTGAFEAHTWFDNVKLLRAPPGQAARLPVSASLWHSGVYELAVSATTGVGTTGTNDGAADREFRSWITPVPQLELDPLPVNTTFLNGIPVSRTGTGNIVSGLGLEWAFAQALPSGTNATATFSNGESVAVTDTTPDVHFPVNSVDFDAGAHNATLFASTTRGSWNRSVVDFVIPDTLSVRDDLEATLDPWSLGNSTHPQEGVGAISQSAVSYTVPRASGDRAVHVQANHSTALGAWARYNVTAVSGAPSVFATVHVNASTSTELASRNNWFDLLTPRNGTDPLVRIGFLDGDHSVDIQYADGSGNATTMYDVRPLEPGQSYKVEARLYDHDVDVYVDGSFVGRFARLSEGRMDNLFFGAAEGTGDVGEIYVDDIGVAERRATSHVLLRDELGDTSIWSGIDGTAVTVTPLVPFARTLSVTSLASDAHVANRSLAPTSSDMDWSFQALATAGPAGTSESFDLLRVADNNDIPIWAVALVSGLNLGAWNGTGYEETNTALTNDKWGRFDVTVTPAGYRVWMNGEPLRSASSGDIVFPIGSDGAGTNLSTGGGTGTVHIANIETFSGERYATESAETAGHGWTTTENGAQARLASTGTLAAAVPERFVSGERAHFVKGSGSLHAWGAVERPFSMPDRFNLTSWVYLVDDATVTFDNLTILGIRNATDTTVLEVTADADGTDTLLYVTAETEGFSGQAAGVGTTASVPRGQWLRLSLEVDRTNDTYTLTTSTGDEIHGEASGGGAWTKVVVGDLRTGSGAGETGQGEAFWDDIVIRSLNRHPIPVIDSDVPDTVSEDFDLYGNLTDEFQDPLTRLEVQVGMGDWVPIAKQAFWSTMINEAELSDGDWHWVNVRAIDGDRFGTDSVKVCYDTTAPMDCAGGQTQGQRAVKVGKFIVNV